MESKLQLLIVTEDSSMKLPPFESAFAHHFRTRVIGPENVQASLDSACPEAILIIGSPSGPILSVDLRPKLPEPAVAIVVYAPGAPKETRLGWLQRGADEVIVIDIDPEEMCVRLRARIDRLRSISRGVVGEHSIRAGRLCLDLDRMEARVAGEKVSLGPVEFKILCVLAKGLDKLRSRDEIETFVWGDNKPASRALDPHINAIRKKIVGSKLELRTVYGAGYSLRSTASPAEGRESNN